jgi:signal transduction histidine kinase/DNA-binding LacI/PurR family transcriptional regulator/ActR/RegA family two-component response regulator
MSRSPRSRPVVGVLTSRLLELFEAQWLGSVDAAAAHDCDLICFMGRELADGRGYRTRANTIYDLVSAHRLDALVIWTQTLGLYVGPARMEQFCRRFEPLPIVSIEQPLGDAPVVLMDNRRGMHDAVSHLIQAHGRRRIAFVRGPANHNGAHERFAGYLDALSSHGLSSDPSLISAPAVSWGPEVAAGAANVFLDLPEPLRADAIVAANDDLAIGVLSALDARQVRTPDDVAVVGFDDFTNIRNHDVGFESPEDETGAVRRSVNVSSSTLSLTTVRGPFHAMGWRGIELALARLRGEAVPEAVTIPTELVVRRSCGCFPATSPPAGGELFQPLTRTAALPADWADRLAAAYVIDTQGGPDGGFLPVLDGFLRASMRAGASIESWWPELFALRDQTWTGLTSPVARERADDIWMRVQLLMNEASERSWRYTQVLAEKRNQIVREVGQRLITAPDVAGLAEALAEELPKVGVPSCYLASYESGPAGGSAAKDPSERGTAWARSLLAYEGGKTVELADEEAVFPSRQLVPADLLRRGQRYSLVAAPLYFKADELGFVLFELGPRIGWIYEALQEQVASALQGALMVERERRALAAVEDARQRLESALAERARLLHETRAKNALLEQEVRQRKEAESALQTAHAELERRVADRTAELARANEVLKEQIVERERAEQMQAKLEAQLRHAQKMEAIGRLAGGIAHDFNNLLVVINGNSDILLRRIPESDPIRADVADIHYAGERAANLTRQLLAFSRQQVLQPEQVDLNEVIGAIEVMLRRLLGEDIVLTTKLAPAAPPIWADAGQIEQILFNLTINARDAMPDGGTVTVETASLAHDPDDLSAPVGLAAGEYVMLRLSDTGAGMDEATQARIFEPFFTTKPTGKGTGLGLATVFGIVQQTGGHIAVTSAPGAGTSFEVYLPQVHPSDVGTVDTAPAAANLSGTETILLVEDDSGVRTTASRFLAGYGYQVLEAVDGNDALRISQEHRGPLDLVITDVVMPGMGGPELVTRLAARRPATPVLYVSGYTDSSAVRDALTDASVALLHKPFTAPDLAARVRELLDRSSHSPASS